MRKSCVLLNRIIDRAEWQLGLPKGHFASWHVYVRLGFSDSEDFRCHNLWKSSSNASLPTPHTTPPPSWPRGNIFSADSRELPFSAQKWAKSNHREPQDQEKDPFLICAIKESSALHKRAYIPSNSDADTDRSCIIIKPWLNVQRGTTVKWSRCRW